MNTDEVPDCPKTNIGAGEAVKSLETKSPETEAVADAVPPQQIPELIQNLRISAGTIDGVSKCALLLSGTLYGIGLVITNFNAQRYGRTNLSLVESQYVLVGLLWLALTLLSFALTNSACRWVNYNGPWRSRPLRKNFSPAMWVCLGFVGLLAVYMQTVAFLGVEKAYGSFVPFGMLGTLIFTNLSLGALFHDTVREMKSRALPGDSFPVKLWRTDSIQVSKRILFVFLSMSLYALFVYPNISPAVGGGKLHRAHFIIKQDHRNAFDTLGEFKVDGTGRLGPVSVVAESDQSYLITALNRTWWDLSPRQSVEVRKDLIELVIYGQ